MKIKTNMNRLTRVHDNVNLPPIETQVLNYIKSTGIFKTVKFLVKGQFVGFVADNAYINIKYDCYRLIMEYGGDYFQFSKRADWSRAVEYTLEFNEKNLHTSNWKIDDFLNTVKKIMDANEQAKLLTAQFPETKESTNRISKAINDYFKNPLIKAKYDVFISNIIAKDNDITKGIWSWLHFEFVGIKGRGGDANQFVGVELFMDGSIKNPRIEEMVGIIGEKNTISLAKMNERLKLLTDFEAKIKAFDGTKIPVLQDFLALQKKGYALRKKIGAI